MFKTIKYTICLIALGASIFQGCKNVSENNTDTLTVCTNATYPPYEAVNKDGSLIGFDIDLANELSKKLNKKLFLRNMDFDSLILGLNQNKCDLIMAGLSITSKREREIEMVQYQGDLVKTYALLFWGNTPNNIKKIEDIGNLENKTIVVQVGTWMEEYLNTISTPFNITVKPLESISELLLDIKHGKSIAAFVETNVVANILKKEQALSYIEFPLPIESWNRGNGIGIKKSNRLLLKQIYDTIRDLNQSGVIKRLEKKWMENIGKR